MSKIKELLARRRDKTINDILKRFKTHRIYDASRDAWIDPSGEKEPIPDFRVG